MAGFCLGSASRFGCETLHSTLTHRHPRQTGRAFAASHPEIRRQLAFSGPKPGSHEEAHCQASSIVLSAQRWRMTRNIRFHPVKGLKWRTTAEYLRWRPIMYVRRGVERSCPQGIGETGVVEMARTALVSTPIVRLATPFESEPSVFGLDSRHWILPGAYCGVHMLERSPRARGHPQNLKGKPRFYPDGW